ncbi:MAG: VWA domain-containing protein [Allomuricauda sp.]
MELRTVLLIALAAIAALTIVFYQYFYKNPRKGSLRVVLAILRFLTLFCGLLLLINPKFVHKDYFLEKTNLILLVDDSSSMQNASTGAVITEKIQKIIGDNDLNERFSLYQYAFGAKVQPTDTFSFNQGNTDISNALSTMQEIFANGNNAIVLFTDGNQTLGRDYAYTNTGNTMAVNPVVVGDTTVYEDMSVGLVNVNSYAFLKNKFPVEATVLYTGAKPVSKTVTISVDGAPVHRERVDFSKTNTSRTISSLIEAQSVGIKTIKIQVESLENERNLFNNSKETAIEVIDEKTNVAIVSNVLHPDIGALRKSIEANEQRSVTLLNPAKDRIDLENIDLLILYQPDRNFGDIYDRIAKSGINHFTITGTKTDWNFLNRAQQSFSKDNVNQSEEILPVLNNTFSVFGLGDFKVDGFPPLQGNLGNIELKKEAETILFQQIRGVDLDLPLFAIIHEGKQREAVLFGENIWKWRAQTFRNDQSFQGFDDFMGKLMVYLASNDQRSRLELDFPSVFNNAGMAQIKASYFDESYQFDPSANIRISVSGKGNGFQRESPMLLKGSFYEVDLSDLEAGEYLFTMTVDGENLKRSGSFKILDFNPERQLLSANYSNLKRLADNTGGKLYFPNDLDAMVNDLSTSEQYRPIQKSKQNVVSLIDFRMLFGLIVLTLALEWFIRKYNGLI